MGFWEGLLSVATGGLSDLGRGQPVGSGTADLVNEVFPDYTFAGQVLPSLLAPSGAANRDIHKIYNSPGDWTQKASSIFDRLADPTNSVNYSLENMGKQLPEGIRSAAPAIGSIIGTIAYPVAGTALGYGIGAHIAGQNSQQAQMGAGLSATTAYAASAAGGAYNDMTGWGDSSLMQAGTPASASALTPAEAAYAGAYSNAYAQPNYFQVDQSLSLEPYSDYTGAGQTFQVNQGLAPEGYFPQQDYTGGQFFQVDQSLNPSSPQYNPTKWYEDALQNPKVKDLAKKLGQKGFQMLMQGMMGKPKPYPNPMQAASIPNYGQIPTTPQSQFNATPQTGMMDSNVEFSKPGVMDTKPMNPLETTDYSLKKTKEEEDKKKLEETLAAQLKPAYLSDYTYWNRLA
jgi:hypothetical protein